jgi:hypothetical protein
MQTEIKTIEKDTAKEVDDLHIKLPNGRVIEKAKRVFRTRHAETKDGRKVELTLDDVVYERVKGALIRRTGKVKMTKAEKKASKRVKRDERRVVAQG